jgi:diguanylate cyclase (GGDEF)-like protein/PAS domain S-box-containing protein
MLHRYAKLFLIQWVFWGAAMLGLAGLAAYTLYADHVRTETEEQAQLLALARLINTNLSKQLESTDRVLMGLQEELAALPAKQRFTSERNDHLLRLQQALTGIRTLLVLDAFGTARLSNRAELIGGNFHQRDYFQQPLNDPNPGKVFVSTPFKTVLGVWAINLTRVIKNSRGEFAGVITATLDYDYFGTLLASVRYAEDARAVLIHGDGPAFYAVPSDSLVVGQSVARPGTFFARHRDSGRSESAFVGTTPVTDERRLIVFNTINPAAVPMDKPLVISISRDQAAVFAAWRVNARTYGWVLALTLLLSLLALAGTQRRQRAQLTQLAQADALLQREHEQLNEAQRLARIGSWELELATNRLHWSDEIFRLFEIDPSRFEASYEGFLKVIHPDDRTAVDQAYTHSLATRQPYEITHRLRMADGRIKWVHERCETEFDAEGAATRSLGTVQDITAIKMAEEELRVAAAAFETDEGILITDTRGVILRANRAFTRISGYAAEEAIGQRPSILQSGRQDQEFYRRMWATLLQDRYWEGEVWNRRKTGEVYPEWLTITAVVDPQDRVSHYVAVFSDITERKATEEQVRRLAFYDPLTQLPNRRLLQDRCEQALRGSARHKNHGAVLFLDLDRFKLLNDTRGHDMGDLLLQEVARRMLACVRAEDTVARMGGDEFVVVLQELSSDPQTALEQARAVAEKIREALDQPYSLGEFTHDSSPSIGVCLFGGRETTVTELLMHADQAMYQAKAAGRNTVRVFEA